VNECLSLLQNVNDSTTLWQLFSEKLSVCLVRAVASVCDSDLAGGHVN